MTPNLQPDYSDPDEVTKLAASPAGERGYRNHLITQSYYAIGCKLRDVFGQANADWATTAAWASGAVGVIIRHEEAETSRILRFSKRLAPSLYDEVLDQTRKNLEEGNRQVYAELGWAFAKLAQGLANGVLGDPDDDLDFLAFLPPVGRSVPVEWQARTDLKPAFLLYLEVLRLHNKEHENDGDLQQSTKLQSELIFTANVLVTVAEQAGLQPYLDAGFARVSRFIQRNPLAHVPYVRGLSQVVAYAGQALGQRIVTEFGIKVPVGEHSLSVGESIRKHRDGRIWAKDLEVLNDPRAQCVWRKYSRARESGRGSSASDWTVMDDRMNYITNFFRAWQQEEDLRGEPAFLRNKPEAPAL